MIHALTCLPIPASTALGTSAIRLCGVPLELLTQELKGSRSAPSLQQLRELDMRAESIVEVDGFQFHSSRQSMRKDLQRNNASTSQGFRVLRYMPEDLWARPTEVIAQIQQVLRAQVR
ncbi:endonuclease domain-containing protein [Pseudarthrobacter sp. J1738]|uniref:endonuclease domain-containing protein n=1 Tax=Pseudarthrobacter sp. J1738 TaxID=3420446 RepID=UPI003D293F29